MAEMTRQRGEDVRRGPWPSMLSGVAAVIAGLGVGELIAGLFAPRASPIAAVAGLLVDVAPAWAKELAISWFGTGDKLAILVGIVLVLVVGGALVGLLDRRRSSYALAIVIALGSVGLLAAVVRSGWAAAIPGLLGTVVAAIVLVRLRPRERVEARHAAGGDGTGSEVVTPDSPGPTRRGFLIAAGGITVAGALAAVGGAALSGLLRAGSTVAAVLRLPVPRVAAPPVPEAAELGLPGLSPVVTPNARFYRVDTAFVVPSIAATDWRLRVHGMVDHEFEITWDELVALEFEEFDVTLMCVSNPVGGPYTGNARWLGTRLGPIIERAAPHPEADMVLSSSSDGWTASTPLAVLEETDRAAILAVGMNGEPLPPEHGAPVRMVVPGLYGYVSATKWVVDLELTRFDLATAYWTDRGWAPLGPVKLESRIDVPGARERLSAGRVAVAGVAWHQHVGVAGVDVRFDDGPWLPARLAEAIGIDTWVQWVIDWDATPGRHLIRVRARGADGEVQTEQIEGTVPDGATGLHNVIVDVA